MISPHSVRGLYSGSNSSTAATITPCNNTGTRASMEREWMARCMMRREVAERYNNEMMRGYGGGYNHSISPIERKEVSAAVYGILRDNLPQALENSTTQQELKLIAESIESKLYQTASSPRAYSAFSTLEFRISALATAVLIHSDKTCSNDPKRGISDTCARLSAAARKSLVYCVMVLVSYEKRNLHKEANSFLARNPSPVQRPLQDGYSRERAAAEYYLSLMGNCSNRKLSEKDTSAATTSTSAGDGVKKAASSDDNAVNVQIVLDGSKKVQPFPPTA